MFKNAIVRQPGKSIEDGITSNPSLGKPIYEKALEQHARYVEILESLGVKVEVLPALEAYPDSCFVEDVAVLSSKCAIITRPGASSRQGEVKEIEDVIKSYYSTDQIKQIIAPGTIDGGDVMMVGNHFYIGLSARTNESGANQFIQALETYGHTGSTLSLKETLHLKTDVTYLENNVMVVAGEFIDSPAFESFDVIEVAKEEGYAANCLWVNGTAIVAKGYPNILKAIQSKGYETIEIDTSEYRKIDGSLTCLSLRF